MQGGLLLSLIYLGVHADPGRFASLPRLDGVSWNECLFSCRREDGMFLISFGTVWLFDGNAFDQLISGLSDRRCDFAVCMCDSALPRSARPHFTSLSAACQSVSHHNLLSMKTMAKCKPGAALITIHRHASIPASQKASNRLTCIRYI
jgi:hypothetical protein